MNSNLHKIPCYLVGLSFFQKWDGNALSNWTEYSVVIPYRVGRFDGGDPIQIKVGEGDLSFDWVAGDGLLESLELSEKAGQMLRMKLLESKNGIAVRQTQGAFVPGMDTLLQPFLFFQLKHKRHVHAR